MTAWHMQRKARGVAVLFSVCFFLFLCMFVKEFKILPWAGKAFCFSEWEQLLGISEGSVIDTSWSISQLFARFANKTWPCWNKIYISKYFRSKTCHIYFSVHTAHFVLLFENYRFTCNFFPKCYGLMIIYLLFGMIYETNFCKSLSSLFFFKLVFYHGYETSYIVDK